MRASLTCRRRIAVLVRHGFGVDSTPPATPAAAPTANSGCCARRHEVSTTFITPLALDVSTIGIRIIVAISRRPLKRHPTHGR